MTNPSDNPGSPRPEAENPEVLPRVTELLAKTGEILARVRESSIETLRGFTDLELQPDQVYACFELFHMQDYGMGYNEFFTGERELDAEYNSFDDDGDSFLTELNDFFENLVLSRPVLLTGKYDPLFAEPHKEQLFKWFSECWRAAGGDKSQVPTYFAFGKEYKVRDLNTGEVMSEIEAARRLDFDVRG